MKKMVLAVFGALALMAAFVAGPARAADLAVDGNIRGLCGEVLAAAGAATLNNKCGVVTTEGLTTAAGSDYTLTLTNSVVGASDVVLFQVANQGNSGGAPFIRTVAPASGSVVVIVRNNCIIGGAGPCTAAFNGNLLLRFMVIKFGS